MRLPTFPAVPPGADFRPKANDTEPTEADHQPKAIDNAGQPRRDVKPPLVPVQYILNWREILVALEQKNNSSDRETVKRLNERYDGPIITPDQGGQPKVAKEKLIEWWNSLEQRFQEVKQKELDKKATVESQHTYGRSEKVVPDISGAVKPRRKDRKS